MLEVLGFIVLVAICVIVLSIAGLSMTGPGQTVQGIINYLCGEFLANVAVGIFDVLIAFPFLMIPQFGIIMVCLALRRSNKLVNVGILLISSAIMPIIFYLLNNGDAICLAISIIVYIASLPFAVYCSHTLKDGQRDPNTGSKEAHGRSASSTNGVRVGKAGAARQAPLSEERTIQAIAQSCGVEKTDGGGYRLRDRRSGQAGTNPSMVRGCKELQGR